jgi:hypothetical protein
MLNLYNYSLLTIFLVGLAAILVAIEIGCRLGAHAGDQRDDNVSTLEGAIIGLLALMVGFTFAMALNRFEARRDAVLAEANAIGTTALQAHLLGSSIPAGDSRAATVLTSTRCPDISLASGRTGPSTQERA